MAKYKKVTEGTYTNKGYEKIVYSGGVVVEYQLDGKLHREDGPAVIENNRGYKVWYINGLRHREDGPAKVWPNGSKEYWLNDIEVIPKNYHLFAPLQLAKLGLI